MSYGNVRRQITQQQAPEVNPAQCTAYGCPCRATISAEGGKWACGAHAFIPPDRWDGVSHLLSDHKWLVEFIDEMATMDRRHQDWREFAIQFWANEPVCAPDPRENAVPYQNRMRGELLYRVGLAKRPSVRLPAQIKPGGFRFSSLGGAA